MNKTNYFNRSIFLLTILFTLTIATLAQTSVFTYQGRLTDNTLNAQGTYQMKFSIHDAVAGGTQIGMTITDKNVSVVNGVFTVQLDFGAMAFDGSDRFIAIAVCQANCPTYTTLNPRQQITSAPYATKALGATTAITAATATNSTQLGGVAASQYIQEGDTRLTDARNPTAGSANYLQNSTSPQATSDFNISGTGTSDIFSAATQFNIGTNRVLSVAGTDNSFVGVGTGTNNTGNQNSFFGSSAGQANTTGTFNSFSGALAGQTNTTGGENSFFGAFAGRFTTTGGNNSFVGADAGQANTTGFSNSFFGNDAGRVNMTGNHNSVFGDGANFSINNLTFATAIGSNSVVTANNTIQLGRDGIDFVRIGNLGASSGTFLCQNTNDEIAGCSNTPLTNAGAFIQNGTDQQATSNFNISGTGTADIFSATTQFNLGNDRVLAIDRANTNLFVGPNTGINIQTTPISFAENTFVGYDAGFATVQARRTSVFGFEAGRNMGTTGFIAEDNALFGYQAGFNLLGDRNSFFGALAGVSSSQANDNSFFGYESGYSNTIGRDNSFFGKGSGFDNIDGIENSFFGSTAGKDNTTGDRNSFFGMRAGPINTTGSDNTFVGNRTGDDNTTGSFNTFIGSNAGSDRGNGNNNTIIGYRANTAPNTTLNFATAIGSESVVETDNTIVMGRANGMDIVRVYGLGTGGTTALCRNANSEISTCNSFADSEQSKANVEKIEQLQEKIKEQQTIIDELLKLVCAEKRDAEICKEVK